MSSNLLALIALLLMLSMLASVLTMVKERRKRLYREEHGQTYPHPELDNIPRLRFLRWVHGLLVVGHGAVLLGVVQLISFTIGIVLFLVLPWLVFLVLHALLFRSSWNHWQNLPHPQTN